MARVLENMGLSCEGREQTENVEGQNCTTNQSASANSPSYDQTLPFIDFLEEHREPVPSVEKPLKAKVHEEEPIREENQIEYTSRVDPPAK